MRLHNNDPSTDLVRQSAASASWASRLKKLSQQIASPFLGHHRSSLPLRAPAVIFGHFGHGNAITGTTLLAGTARHFGAALVDTATFGRLFGRPVGVALV